MHVMHENTVQEHRLCKFSCKKGSMGKFNNVIEQAFSASGLKTPHKLIIHLSASKRTELNNQKYMHL